MAFNYFDLTNHQKCNISAINPVFVGVNILILRDGKMKGVLE